MYLLTPIYNYCKPGTMYGAAGDKVSLISIHDQVAVVEHDVTKERFSIPLIELSDVAQDDHLERVQRVRNESDYMEKRANQQLRKQKRANTRGSGEGVGEVPSLF